MVILAYCIGLILTLLAWYFFQYPSTCCNDCMMTLQNWLLGFAVVSTVCLVYLGLFLMFSHKIQFDLGFSLHIVVGIVFGLFFFIYHWFAYTALFGSSSTCMTDAGPLWIATFVIVVIQICAIPCGGLFVALLWMMDKFEKKLPDKNETNQPTTSISPVSTLVQSQQTDGDVVIIEL
jgi:hypothetical protein